jgi:hypothetical protein
MAQESPSTGGRRTLLEGGAHRGHHLGWPIHVEEVTGAFDRRHPATSRLEPPGVLLAHIGRPRAPNTAERPPARRLHHAPEILRIRPLVQGGERGAIDGPAVVVALGHEVQEEPLDQDVVEPGPAEVTPEAIARGGGRGRGQQINDARRFGGVGRDGGRPDVEEADAPKARRLPAGGAKRDAAAERVAHDPQWWRQIEGAGRGEHVVGEGRQVRARRKRGRGSVPGEIDRDHAQPGLATREPVRQPRQIPARTEDTVEQHDGRASLAVPLMSENASRHQPSEPRGRLLRAQAAMGRR